jgi:hypothetical protein
MFVDVHQLEYLMRLGEMPTAELVAHRPGIERFLATLWDAATPSARQAFAERIAHIPAAARPWGAVQAARPNDALAVGAAAGVEPPPALVLLMDRAPDDPDDDGEGSRLPAPDDGLVEALLRWNLKEVRRWMGPLGWQQPPPAVVLDRDLGLEAERPPAAVGFSPTRATNPSAVTAAEELDARSDRRLRVVGAVAAVGVSSSLLFALARASRQKDILP